MRSFCHRFSILLILTTLLVGFSSNTSYAAGPTCTVGTASYPTIQSAANDLTCTKIVLPAGIYSEQVVIGHNLTVEGAGADVTTINGGGIGTVIFITNTTVSLVGLTITGGAGTNIFNAGNLWGGGILNYQGTVTITAGAVSSNTADNGAGIYNYGGSLEIVESTVQSNTAELYGGGINNWGTLTVTNSTFSGNNGGFGGGIFSQDRVTLRNTTISGNSANSGGGGIYVFGSQGSLEVSNTLVANSPSGGDCLVDAPAVTINGGYNLVEDGTCFSGGTNLSGDPLLVGLANNGGHTLTYALLADSPARNAIPQAINGCGTSVITDQRGYSRPAPTGGSCDIGALEMQSANSFLPFIDKPFIDK